MEYLDCDKTIITTLINDLRKKIKELEKENNTLENNKILQIKLIDSLTVKISKFENKKINLKQKNIDLEEQNLNLKEKNSKLEDKII